MYMLFLTLWRALKFRTITKNTWGW